MKFLPTLTSADISLAVCMWRKKDRQDVSSPQSRNNWEFPVQMIVHLAIKHLKKIPEFWWVWVSSYKITIRVVKILPATQVQAQLIHYLQSQWRTCLVARERSLQLVLPSYPLTEHDIVISSSNFLWGNTSKPQVSVVAGTPKGIVSNLSVMIIHSHQLWGANRKQVLLLLEGNYLQCRVIERQNFCTLIYSPNDWNTQGWAK